MPSPKHIPEGYRTVSPYLTVNGAAQLLEFVKQVFDAEELSRHDDPERGIAHAAVRIGDSTIEISDGTDAWPAMPCALHIYVPDVDAVYARAVDAGAESLMEPTDHDYGERSAAVRDAAGNNWYIATLLDAIYGGSEEETDGAVAEHGSNTARHAAVAQGAQYVSQSARRVTTSAGWVADRAREAREAAAKEKEGAGDATETSDTENVTAQ